jgi:alpha-tubulin suppressor-like RCC1 family protein
MASPFTIRANSGERPLTSSVPAVPTLAPDYHGAIALSAGRNFLCALMPSGQVICGGDSSQSGKLGYFQRSSGPYAPLPVPGLQDVIELGSGPSHNCALTRSDEVYCWGSNIFRQLGQPFPMMRFDGPVRLPLP